MRAGVATIVLTLLLLPAAVGAAPSAREPRFDPRGAAAIPTYVQRVQPALIGLHVKAAPDRPTSTRCPAHDSNPASSRNTGHGSDSGQLRPACCS